MSIANCNGKFSSPQTVRQGWVLLSKSALKSRHFHGLHPIREQAVLAVINKCIWRTGSGDPIPSAIHGNAMGSSSAAREKHLDHHSSYLNTFSVKVFGFAQRPAPHPKDHHMSLIQLIAFFPFILFLPSPLLSPTYSHLLSHLLFFFLRKEGSACLKIIIFSIQTSDLW